MVLTRSEEPYYKHVQRKQMLFEGDLLYTGVARYSHPIFFVCLSFVLTGFMSEWSTLLRWNSRREAACGWASTATNTACSRWDSDEDASTVLQFPRWSLTCFTFKVAWDNWADLHRAWKWKGSPVEDTRRSTEGGGFKRSRIQCSVCFETLIPTLITMSIFNHCSFSQPAACAQSSQKDMPDCVKDMILFLFL